MNRILKPTTYVLAVAYFLVDAAFIVAYAGMPIGINAKPLSLLAAEQGMKKTFSTH